MIISHEKKFLFLHIPKTAGTSVRNALLPYANPLEVELKSRIIRRILNGFTPYKYIDFRHYPHWTLSKAQNTLPAYIFDSYTKFCFVRHPVDWQYSMFRHILSHSHLPKFKKEFGFIYENSDFEEYINWRIEQGVIPQAIQMINKDKSLGVDIVARFENIQNDFQRICNSVNITATLPFLNKNNKNKNNKDKVISDNARELIYKHYKIDYELFGYTLEGVNPDWSYDKGKDVSELNDLYNILGIEFDVWDANTSLYI